MENTCNNCKHLKNDTYCKLFYDKKIICTGEYYEPFSDKDKLLSCLAEIGIEYKIDIYDCKTITPNIYNFTERIVVNNTIIATFDKQGKLIK